MALIGSSIVISVRFMTRMISMIELRLCTNMEANFANNETIYDTPLITCKVEHSLNLKMVDLLIGKYDSLLISTISIYYFAGNNFQCELIEGRKISRVF